MPGGDCVFTLSAFAIIGIVITTGLEEDKVCFLDDQSPACVNHQLGCVRTEIAIQSVQYSYASNCTCVRNKCTSCRSDGRSVPIQASGICSNDYNTDDYWNIVTKCSKKITCLSPVSNLRQFKECGSMMAFSHVRYRCVDATFEIRMCEDQEVVGQYLPLFYDGLRSTSAGQRCVCVVNGSDPSSTNQYNITALDIRLGNVDDQDVPQLVLSSPDNEPTVINHKTDIRPNTLLLTTQLSSEVRLDFKSNHTPERIWIMIEGQEKVGVKCETITKIPVTKKSPSSKSPTSSTAASSFIGIFMAGVGTCAVVLFVIAALVYVLVIKRRYNITPKRQDNIPASTEHPTYAGLLERKQDGNYELVNDSRRNNPQLSRDYQNI